MKEINTRVINKHDYEVNWIKATNFIPKRGELIIYDAEFDDLGNTVALPAGRTEPIFYARYKIGDGVTKVNSLPFASESTGELITVDDIDAICGTTIQDTSLSEVKF